MVAVVVGRRQVDLVVTVVANGVQSAREVDIGIASSGLSRPEYSTLL